MKQTLQLKTNAIIRVLLTGIMFLSFTNSYCQSLTGVVKNKNGEALSNSIAYLNKSDINGKKYHQKTDGTGKFNFRPDSAGKYFLSIKSIGYLIYHDTVSIASDRDLGTITLVRVEDTISKTTKLNEVKIFAQKSIVTHLLDKEIIDVESSYLGKLPGIMDLLNQIPEITVSDGGGLSVLGKTDVAIFIDGHPTSLSVQSIPLQNISKIELITNPSAKYDGNMEAVINIILKKGISNGFQGNFFSNYEQRHGNLYSFGGALSYNSGIFNSSLSVGYYEAAAYQNNTNSNTIFQNNGPAYALNTNLGESSYGYVYSIDLEMALLINKNNKISFNSTWQPNYTPRDNYSEKDIFTNNATAKVDSSTTSNVLWSYHTRYANGGLSYISTNELFTIESRFDIYWQDDGTKTYNNFVFNNFNSISDNVPVSINTSQYRTSIAYVPSMNFAHPFKKSKLEFGAKYYYISSNFYLDFSDVNFYSPEQNNLFSSKEDIYAAYINYEGSIKKLSYEFGLRNEYSMLSGYFNNVPNNYNLSRLLPSAIITYTVSPTSRFILSYSEKLNRVPFARESPLFYYTGPFTAFEGNPSLKPQTLQSLQVKYVYNSYYATLYYNNYTNFLSTLPYINGNTTILKFSNSEREIYGIILGAPISFEKWWSSQNNLKIYHQGSKGVIDTITFNVGSWTSNVSVTENFKIKNVFNSSLLFNYTLPYFSGVNRIKTGPSLDLNFTRSVANKRIDLGIYARDILNTYSVTYISRNIESTKYNATVNKDTRGISVSVKYNFKKGRSTEKASESNDEIESRL